MTDVTEQDIDRAIALASRARDQRALEEEQQLSPEEQRQEFLRNPPAYLSDLTPEQLAELDERAGREVGAGEGFSSFDATNIPLAGAGFEVSNILDDQQRATRIETGVATPEERFRFARDRVEEARPRTFLGGVGEMAVDSATIMAEMGLAAAGGAGAAALSTRLGLRAAATGAASGVRAMAIRRAAEVGALATAKEYVPQVLGHAGGAWTLNSMRGALPDLDLTDDEAEALAVMADRDFANNLLGRSFEEVPQWQGAARTLLNLGIERAGGRAIASIPGVSNVKAFQARVWQKLAGQGDKATRVRRLMAGLADNAAYDGAVQETLEELLQNAVDEELFGDGALQGMPSSFRELAQIVTVGALPGTVAAGFSRIVGLTERAAAAEKQASDEAGGTEQAPTEGGDSVSPEVPTDVNQGVTEGVTEVAEAARPEEADRATTPEGELGSPELLAPQEYSGPPGTFEAVPIGREMFGTLHEVPEITEGKTVTTPDVMNALGGIVRAAGSEPVIRQGLAAHLPKRARGSFRLFSQVVNLRRANDIVTGAHEVAHNLEHVRFGQSNPWVEGGAAKISPDARAELEQLGRDLYGSEIPAGGYLREGWAEFISFYITQDGVAKAPQMMQWMQDEFLPGNPKIADAIRKAQDHARVWRFQGAANRAQESVVSIPGPVERAVRAVRDTFSRQGWQRFADAWIEELGPLQRAAKFAQETAGAALRAADNPYRLAKAFRGKAASRVKYMIERGMIDLAGNRTGVKALSEIKQMIRGRDEDFSIFLFARRAKALWEQPITDNLQDGQSFREALAVMRQRVPGLTDEQILSQLGARDPGLSYADTLQVLAEYDDANFEAAAELVYQWYRGVMDYVRQSSPTLRQAIDRIEQIDPGYYVPLRRVFNVLEGHSRRAGSAQRGSVSKRLKGSGRQVRDPFEQIIAQATEMVELAHSRLVLDSVIALGERHEGLGGIIQEVPVSSVPGGALSVDDALREAAKRVKDESVELGEAIDTVRGALGSSADAVITLFAKARDPKQDGDAPILPVVQNGAVKWYQVHKDIHQALAGVNPKRLPRILDLVFGVPKRAFTMGTTQIMPDFALVANPSRDYMTYSANTSAGNPVRAFASYAQSMLPAFKASTGLTGDVDAIEDFMLRSGVRMAQRHREDGLSTRSLARSLKGKGLNLVNYSGDTMRFALDVMNTPELIPRIAEMRNKARELEYDFTEPIDLDTMVELIEAGAEVTVDFQAAGRYARVVNQVVPFFNVAIQSPRAMMRAFRRNPAAFTVNALAQATVPAAALWLLNREEEWYQEMPDSQRYTNFYVRAGDRLVKVPRAFEFHYFFATVPEILLNNWAAEDEAGAVEFAKRLVGDLYREGDRALIPSTLMPMPVQAAFEHAKNEDSFFGTPIIPRSLEQAHPADQYNEFTSRAAKEAGKALGMSPILMEHYIESFFGSLGRKALQATGRDINALERASGLDSAPLVGRLLVTGGPDSVRSRSVDGIYELRQKLNADRIHRQKEHEKETEAHKQERAYVNDAVRALSSMGRLATLAKTPQDRSDLLRRRRELAKEALTAHEKGQWRRIARRLDNQAKALSRQRDRAEADFRERLATQSSN